MVRIYTGGALVKVQVKGSEEEGMGPREVVQSQLRFLGLDTHIHNSSEVMYEKDYQLLKILREQGARMDITGEEFLNNNNFKKHYTMEEVLKMILETKGLREEYEADIVVNAEYYEARRDLFTKLCIVLRKLDSGHVKAEKEGEIKNV